MTKKFIGMFYKFFIICLVLFSLPLQLVIGFLIALTSGFPIFYRQKRIGKNGKLFTLYKFRTMQIGADAVQKNLMKRNEATGPVFKIRNDPRFTHVGKFLSHTGLDELPQMINILYGDMALIGPRPLPVTEAKKLTSWQQQRHCIKPGIISPAILFGNYHKNFDRWMESDVAYVQSKSMRGDIMIVIRSLIFLLHLLVKEFFARN